MSAPLTLIYPEDPYMDSSLFERGRNILDFHPKFSLNAVDAARVNPMQFEVCVKCAQCPNETWIGVDRKIYDEVIKRMDLQRKLRIFRE